MTRDAENKAQRAHELIDRLPAAKISVVVDLLEAILEPVASSIENAPVEEEEVTSETAEAIARARASLARGEGIPHEEILREFGLKK
jgi:hypothetical protein